MIIKYLHFDPMDPFSILLKNCSCKRQHNASKYALCPCYQKDAMIHRDSRYLAISSHLTIAGVSGMVRPQIPPKSLRMIRHCWLPMCAAIRSNQSWYGWVAANPPCGSWLSCHQKGARDDTLQDVFVCLVCPDLVFLNYSERSISAVYSLTLKSFRLTSAIC